MARLTVNGAVVSDDGQWYSTGFRWRPLVARPASKAPGYISPEGKQLAALARASKAATLGSAGEELARLVAAHGSLAAAEQAIVAAAERARVEAEAAHEAETVAAMQANYGRRSDDGRWWWDGERWQPVSPA